MTRLPPQDALVARLSAIFGVRRRDVLIGIGDDAAVVRPGEPVALTTDVLVEGEDFTSASDPRRLGRKALSVNLSDLAAMGATPLYALLTLGLPRDTDPVWVEAFAQGMKSVATEHGVAIVGGDLSASKTAFAGVTAVGRASKKGLLTRSGASAGDALFVSGTLGAAAAGLQLLQNGFSLREDGAVVLPSGRRAAAPRDVEIARLIRHQIDPRPAVELGRALAEKGIASAAIDLSDGFARDLHRLCRASGVGARVTLADLPVDSALADLKGVVPLDPALAALFGGEDFGLLFAVPKANVGALRRLSGRFPIRRVGTLDGTRALRLVTAAGEEPLPEAGFDHFSPDTVLPASPAAAPRPRRRRTG